jgi:S-adenosylmethionine synthetase
MAKEKRLLTSESVTEGHPDKLCDQISDAVLDEVLRQDTHGRVACETFVSMGLVIIGGEITTEAYVDVHKLVRKLVKEIGYTNPHFGFDYESCAILNAIHSQSVDIAQGVNRGGAGDQGVMIGFACSETVELMPLPITLAHKLVMRLTEVRKKEILKFLGPDGKSQVSVEYRNGKPKRVDSVVIACQHSPDILDGSGQRITKKARKQIIRAVVEPILAKWIDKETKFYVNETGKFIIGGPQSDTGMTGRKVIVDTYGGLVSHGGGAFSGKDPTKVDRSASYMARYIAKNIVAAGLAQKCLVQLAYVIGRADPLAIYVDTFGTARISENRLARLIRKHFALTPRGIIEMLDLKRPIYLKTACYGHFGRNDEHFSWEKTDRTRILQKEA